MDGVLEGLQGGDPAAFLRLLAGDNSANAPPPAPATLSTAAPPRALSVQLQGGLGNQLFQLATALALSVRCPGLEPHFRRVLSSPSIFQPRGVYWDTLLRELPTVPNPSVLEDSRTEGKDDTPARPVVQVKEQSAFAYHPLVVPLCRSAGEEVVLAGYFQSEQYFDDCRPQVLKAFKPSGAMAKMRALREGLVLAVTGAATTEKDSQGTRRNPVAVSLHVRRGDYLKLEDTLPAQPTTYYHKAVTRLEQTLASGEGESEGGEGGAEEPAYIYLIFSDDPQWCESELLPALPSQTPSRMYTIVSGRDVSQWVRADDDGGERCLADWEELLLQSVCAHHIVANSSFSWWGAWLSEPEDRARSHNEKQEAGTHKHVVMAPKRWYGAKLASQALMAAMAAGSTDLARPWLCPPSWTVI